MPSADVAHPGLSFHFVANVDGADLASVLARVVPAETLFVVASKTFTTQETMTNAETARAWFVAQGGTRIEEHFVAATSNVEAAARFGITRTFGFWDWVGGRYSLWSAIGLPIAIAIGAERFRELLAGARAMDEHFAQAPVERNLPMLLGLVDVWYRNFHGFTSRCIAPYAQALQRLPAYLQQLEMESNGKRVDRSGAPLPFATSPVVWGEPGTNAQHAYFQMLHQGSDVVPVEFILLKQSSAVASGISPEASARQHRMLLANGLAQSQALMQGRASADEPHRDFPGNRPSTTLLLDRLTPRSLGALLALYEHRVFTSGAVWGIDSFDQWGVELGKTLGARLLPLLDCRCGSPRRSRRRRPPGCCAGSAREAGLAAGRGAARTCRAGRPVESCQDRVMPSPARSMIRFLLAIALACAVSAAQLTSGSRLPRVGVLYLASPSAGEGPTSGFDKGMRELGYVRGPQRRHRMALRRRAAGSAAGARRRAGGGRRSTSSSPADPGRWRRRDSPRPR